MSVLPVDLATGKLTQVPGSPFRAGKGPYSVAFSPTAGDRLATANYHDSTVSVFSVDRSTGRPNPGAGLRHRKLGRPLGALPAIEGGAATSQSPPAPLPRP
ncbi:MAG: hypothetical protein JO372_12035, partial [Solirubrobacterales bacterium]|nr:hypothetical protein [Solirubrobacterales bacterium]